MMRMSNKEHAMFAFVIIAILLLSYSFGAFTGAVTGGIPGDGVIIDPGTGFNLPGDGGNTVLPYSSCYNIVSQGSYYISVPLTGTQPGTNYCIKINASNVIFDCHNIPITGTGAAGCDYGIYVMSQNGLTNVTVINCNVQNYYVDGIFFNFVNAGNISKNVVNNNGNGIELFSSTINDLIGNSGTNNRLDGIFSHCMPSGEFCSGGNTLTRNIMNNNGQYGYEFLWMSSNTLVSNTGNNNNEGFNFASSRSNTLTSNTGNNNANEGFYLSSSNGNTLTRNSASGNSPDFHSALSSGNTVNNFTTGSTTSSFTYDGNLMLSSASSVGAATGLKSLPHYLDIGGGNGAWIGLNIYYSDSELGTIKENTLKIYKYDSATSTWSRDLNLTGALSEITNTNLNYVYANISNFASIFAPMGSEGINLTISSPQNTSYNTNSLWFNVTTNIDVTNCSVQIGAAPSVGMAPVYPVYYMSSLSSKSWNFYTTNNFDGLNIATFTCNNAADTSSKSVYFRVDTTGPVVTITKPTGSSTLYSSTATVNANTNEFAPGCTAEFDSSANSSMTNLSAKWEVNKSLGNGAHTVRVYCTDASGNTGVSGLTSFNVSIPHVSMLITINSPANSSVTNTSSVIVTAVTNISALECKAGFDSSTNYSMTYSSGNWSLTRTLNNGTHNVIVYCAAAAEDWSSSKPTYFTLKYNQTTPQTNVSVPFSVTVISPQEGVNYTVKTISVGAYTNKTVSGCSATFDSSDDTFMIYSSGGWYIDKTLTEGKHAVQVYCSDNQGTKAFSDRISFRINLTKSTTAPPIQQQNATTETVPITPVLLAICGDKVCDISETSESCLQDCPGLTTEQQTQGFGIFVIAGLTALGIVLAGLVIFLVFIRPRLAQQGVEEEIPETGEEIRPEKEQMLEAYVRKQMSQGYSQQQIMNALISSGWTEAQAETALELAVVPPQKEAALIEYVTKQFSKGYTAEQINQKMTSSGWSAKEIKHAIKMAKKT